MHMKADNINKLKEIFFTVLELDKECSLEELNSENYKKWDSLAHVLLIAALESEFKILIDVSDYENLTSYSAVKNLLIDYEL